MATRSQMDMTRGPLLGKILKFAAPVVLTNVLQLLYNAADIAIVGQFTENGSQALAAVGATSPIIHLVTNAFMGLSLGTGVAVAQHKGAGEDEEVHKTVHTSILASVICGLIVCAIGLTVSRPMLRLMATPENIIDQSVLYMSIYFCGMPFMMLYNFGASIHRAVGDTRRPLYFLTISGILNVLLNLMFVTVFGMSVDGVALATVISQVLSAVLMTTSLCHAEGCCKLHLSKLKIYWNKLWEVIRIGLPAGIQNSLFSISNVLIQSSINLFGEAAMAAHTAATSLEGFMNAAVSGVADASTNFTGQNVGAGKYQRVRKVSTVCAAAAVVISLVMSTFIVGFGKQLLGLYNKDPEVISLGITRLVISGTMYFIFGLMQVFAGSLRGMGKSMLPMIISIVGVCGLRIVYIYTIFALHPTLEVLYLSYPVSWFCAMAANMISYFVISRRLIAGKWTPAIKAKR